MLAADFHTKSASIFQKTYWSSLGHSHFTSEADVSVRVIMTSHGLQGCKLTPARQPMACAFVVGPVTGVIWGGGGGGTFFLGGAALCGDCFT